MRPFNEEVPRLDVVHVVPTHSDPSSGSGTTMSGSKEDAKLARKRARDRRSQQAMRDRNRGEIDALKFQVVQLSRQLITAREIWAGHATTARSPPSSSHSHEIKCLRRENERLRQKLSRACRITRPSQNSPLRGVMLNPSVLKAWLDSHISAPAPAHETYSPSPSIATDTQCDDDECEFNAFDENHADSECSSPCTTTPFCLLEHSILPKPVPPTCPTDRIIQPFIEEKRRWVQSLLGSPSASSTPRSPSSSLSSDSIKQLQFSISQVVGDLLDTYGEIETLPKKVACLYFISSFVNWLVLQTQEAFEQMPVWLRPCSSQTEIPHPAWMDRVLWPRVRDYLIHHQDITFDQYTYAFTLSFNLHWPYRDEHVIITPQEGESSPKGYRINPIFEEHARNLSNWSVTARFHRLFPEMGKVVDEDIRQFGS